MFTRALLGVVGLTASAGIAFAGPGFVPRTVTVNAPGAINSVGPQGYAANGSFTHAFNGDVFRVGAVRISGTLVDGGLMLNSWANDASWRIVSAQGGARTFQGITQVETYTGPLSVGPTNYSFVDRLHGYTTGTWSFAAYEVAGADESVGTNFPENIWTSAAFEFIEMTPAPLPSGVTPLGAINGTLGHSINHANPNAVHWMSFDFAGGANSFLQIDTLGSNIPLGLNPIGDNDTVIALYDSYGVMVYSSDNINLPTGQLESRFTTDVGLLPAGTYYLAATTASAGVGGNSFNVTNNSFYNEGQGVGSIQVNITAVPAPASLALLGLGGLVAGNRRRSTR